MDVGGALYPSEEAFTSVAVAGAGLTDADAADGLVVAVEVALEVVGATSYGLIVLGVVVALVVGVLERDVSPWVPLTR